MIPPSSTQSVNLHCIQNAFQKHESGGERYTPTQKMCVRVEEKYDDRSAYESFLMISITVSAGGGSTGETRH